MKQSLEGVEVLLLDIEGTICPISFVKDTLLGLLLDICTFSLGDESVGSSTSTSETSTRVTVSNSPISKFPYALKALPEILKTQWDSSEFKPYKTAFPESARESSEAFLAHVQDLTRRDVKIAYLKNLQGYLWEAGYKSGSYSTPLFPDVLPILESFIAHSPSSALPPGKDEDDGKDVKSKRQISIYSSGSIFAQKLLFAHIDVSSSSSSSTTSSTTEPSTKDINPIISSYFDTSNAGPKTSPSSYSAISSLLFPSSPTSSSSPSSPERKICFLSDNPKEIQAALETGMISVLVKREGNPPLKDYFSADEEKQRREFETLLERGDIDVIESFDELEF